MIHGSDAMSGERIGRAELVQGEAHCPDHLQKPSGR